jgi:uncharacterized protein YjiS (DUF1127 family)
MTTTTMFGRPESASHRPSALAMLGHLFATARREIEARRSVRDLDDATLADLGLTRGAIEHAVRTGRRG